VTREHLLAIFVAIVVAGDVLVQHHTVGLLQQLLRL
jgi:hypothetical protein